MAPSYNNNNNNSNNGRRGPNVSHFLRDLNAIHDKPLGEAEFTFEDDLATFTNTEFFDFDSGQNTDYQAPPVKPELKTVPSSATTTTTNTTATSPADDLTLPLGDFQSNLDEFLSTSDFNFGDFNNYHTPGVPSYHGNLGNLQPLQPNSQPQYAAPSVPHQQHQPPPQQNAYVNAGPQTGNNHETGETLNQSNSHLNFEDQSRVAAEEDKRRRNTAASARFRVKKKQREQALEKSAKEMNDKVTQLESRINLLETENRWLKNLVMEKNGSNEEIAAMFKEFDSRHKTTQAAVSSDAVKEEN